MSKKTKEKSTEDLLIEIIVDRARKNPDKPIKKITNEVEKEWNELVEKVKKCQVPRLTKNDNRGDDIA